MLNSKDLYLEERRQAIVDIVEQTGRVSVSELSERLGVSEVTIRSDLQALAERNLIIRTHGGAIPANGGLPDLALIRRQQRQISEKQRIGQACAALIQDGDAIFIDSSSTALAILPHLQSRRQLTLVTNSLVVAQEMQMVSGVSVVMPGGTLHPDTASLIGTEGLAWLDKFNIQKGFFGAHGFSLTAGVTDVSTDEADLKRALVARCDQVIAIIDTTKWDKVGLASFASLDDLDTIISDINAPAELVDEVRTAGVEVILV